MKTKVESTADRDAKDLETIGKGMSADSEIQLDPDDDDVEASTAGVPAANAAPIAPQPVTPHPVKKLLKTQAAPPSTPPTPKSTSNLTKEDLELLMRVMKDNDSIRRQLEDKKTQKMERRKINPKVKLLVVQILTLAVVSLVSWGFMRLSMQYGIIGVSMMYCTWIIIILNLKVGMFIKQKPNENE